MTVVALGGVTSGLLGFLVVLGLVLAAVLLFWSMLRHLRKVPASFDEPRDETPDQSSDVEPRNRLT